VTNQIFASGFHLNILLVTQYFHPEPFRVNDLARGLRDRNHKVTVLTGMPNYPEGRFYAGYSWFRPANENFEGIHVIRVPLVSRGGEKSLRLALNYLSFALFASLLGPLRCRGRYDLIFVFEPSPITVGLPALLLGLIKRAPVMLWVQDLWPETLSAVGQRGTTLAIGTWLAGFVHRRCAALLIQSQAFAQSLLTSGIPASRIHYLPNWAEDLYKSEDAPASFADYRGFRILFAGNLGSSQSLETLLDTAERLQNRHDIHWLIAGDGLMGTWLSEQIRERRLESSITLLGRHPVEKMPAFFAGADALLVTLRSDPVFALTIPSKIQSYLAAGRPILGALDGEGARIINESGAGMVVPAEDAAALTTAVTRMAATTIAERTTMGRRGREYFEAHFERNRLLDRLETWMHELTGRSDAHTDTRG
jgi:colanic acid biosynthesis glycosyl transferase WcaI